MNDDRNNLFEKGYRQYLEKGLSDSACAEITFTESTEYVGDIKKVIAEFEDSIGKRIKPGTKNQYAGGFAAEETHVATFNFDAAIQDKPVRAMTPKSGASCSPDIVTTDGTLVGSKYGKNPVHTADAQSMDLYKKLLQDCPKGKPFEEYKKSKLQELGLDPNLSNGELQSMRAYGDQTALCPSDQITEIQENLRIRSAKDRITPGKEHFGAVKDETADLVCDTVTSRDGAVSSKPLTKDNADKIAKKAQDGTVTAKDIGLAIEKVPYEYILKKSCKIGLRAAIAASTISILPQVFQMLVDEGYSFDDFKNMCETGVANGIEGFLQGSISAGISISCQLGKFGEVLKNANPEMTAYIAGAIAAIAIHTMKNAYLVAMGKKQSRELANEMLSDIFISAGGMVGGALASFIPIPFAGYFIGSAIGSILASFVYKKGYSATIGLCVEYGYTLWGLVKQDYTVPTEILKEIGVDVVEFKRVEYKKVKYRKVGPKRVYPKTIKPKTLDFVFLRRGVIGVNEIGYVF